MGQRGQPGTSRHRKEAAVVVGVQGLGSIAEDGSGNGRWVWMSLQEVDGRELLRRGH